MFAHRYRNVCLLGACLLAALVAAPVAAGAQAVPRSATGATVTLMSDDFEGAWGWWPASGANGGWWLTTSRSDGGTHSAHASSGIGSHFMMSRGPFDLSNATSAALDFDLWYYAPSYIYPYSGTSGTFDIGYSLDGSVFYWPVQWGGDTGGSWAAMQWQMSSLCGQPQVWIAFMVSSSSSMYAGYSEGAYVDNVVLTATLPDTTPPTTVASGYDDDWHNSDVPVTLSATDNAGGSGVKSITYTVDGGASTTVEAASTQVTIDAPADHGNDGIHTIAFYATDNADNQETPDKTCTVKIDTTSPTTAASNLDATAGGSWHKTAVTVTLTPGDGAGASGVAATYYTIDGTQHTYSAPFQVSAQGAHTVTYWSLDDAGNTETPQTGYLNIDSKAPKATVKALNVPAAKAVKGKTLNFKVTIADPTPSCDQASLTFKVTTKTGKLLRHATMSAAPTNKALNGRLCDLQDDGQGHVQDRRHRHRPGRQQTGQGEHCQAEGHLRRP